MTQKSTVRFMTRTAILLALTLVFQVFGKDLASGLLVPPMYQSFVVGPLVNLCLLVATAFAGIWSGVAVALLAPLGAFATGSVPEPLFMPVIALGNVILVLCFATADHMADKLKPHMKLMLRSIGILFGAVFKTIWLWGGITVYMSLFAVQAPVRQLLGFAYSWPQAVTAAIGGVLAIVVLKFLEKAIPKTETAGPAA